ncbi:MAG: hypothetical protein LBH32_08505 [Dysgonamonadaceae bacterium]|jgi:hypothetical protein|nr:hypothetical protein [Dysgonamonadaceae bacterium]
MTEKNRQHQGGRKPKADPAVFRYSVSFNAEEHAEFLSRFEQSGMKIKAHFIVACIFEKSLKVVKYDMAAMEYHARLTNFYAQFRAIGVNYNQVVKAIKATFTEKKALAFLYKLEKATIEMAALNQKIIDLTKEFEEKWLQK